MDRFKFRVFNKDKQKYIENNYKTFLSMNGQFMDEEVTPFMTRTSFVEYSHTIEICTGLKDKNGVLIYENDLGYDINNRLCQVVWCDCNACFDLIDINTKSYRQYDGISEVIGNIHQNKELLNE